MYIIRFPSLSLFILVAQLCLTIMIVVPFTIKEHGKLSEKHLAYRVQCPGSVNYLNCEL